MCKTSWQGVLPVEIQSFSCTNLSRYKKLEDLLEKSFSLVKMPSLQPVVMCVMKHLPKVRVLGLTLSRDQDTCGLPQFGQPAHLPVQLPLAG